MLPGNVKLFSFFYRIYPILFSISWSGKLEISNNCGTVYDSVRIDSVYTLPGVDLGSDTVICVTATLSLSVEHITGTYQWSTGATGGTITPTSSGLYWVKVTDHSSCLGGDSIYVGINSAPFADLGNDTLLCVGEHLTLMAGEGEPTWMGYSGGYEWQVVEAGTYWLQLDDPDLICPPSIDTIEVEYEECQCLVWWPNAFSPNGDAKNDFFKPQINCDVTNYTLKVFNRWGEMVYVSTDSGEPGWDGSYKGKQQELGVFVFMVEYLGRYLGEERHIKRSGSVTLIR